MQLFILFCLQIDLMNNFIFTKLTGICPFIHEYMATILRFLKFKFLRHCYFFYP